MIQLLGLFLTMLTPLTGPVAGERPGVPHDSGARSRPRVEDCAGNTFKKDRHLLRTDISHRRQGLLPGTLIWSHRRNPPLDRLPCRRGGYAGWLSAADATVSLCDHGNYSLASTYRGFTLDYRENSGFFGGYSSERFQAAGGPEAFVAGISPAIGEGFSLGPAWCEDRHGGSAWLRGSFSRGALLVETGGAVEEDRALPRARATLASGGLMASAGV